MNSVGVRLNYTKLGVYVLCVYFYRGTSDAASLQTPLATMPYLAEGTVTLVTAGIMFEGYDGMPIINHWNFW